MSPSSENPLQRVIREIHRRSLWQVTGIYVVASWVVLQIVETLSSLLTLPEWFPGVAIALLLVGFPVVLATAFVQEGGPSTRPTGAGPLEAGGDAARGDPGRTSHDPGLSSVFTWRNAIGGGIVAFALWGVVAAGWLLLGGKAMEAVPGSREDAVPRERSIAVLPFESLSPDQEHEYFSAGLTEELIGVLSRIPGLKVSARTSVFAFRDSDLDVRTIADSLGVEHVLEGSVRRSGDLIRISAQLIEAGSGFHLWSDTFEREFTEVFEIQDAMTRAIADGLAVPLGVESGERLVSAATEDMDAYSLYLQARAAFADRVTVGDVDAALRFYGEAAAADPAYALAHAGAAEAWAARPNYSGEWTSDLVRAEESARTALALDETLARARLVLANVHRDRWQWEEAGRLYLTALQGLPNDAEAHHEYGEYLLDLGRCDEAVQEQRRALETDPLSPVFLHFLGEALLCDGRAGEALAPARRSQELDFRPGAGIYVFMLLEAGRVDEAVRFARSRNGSFSLAVAEAVRDGAPVTLPDGEPPRGSFFRAWGMTLAGDREAALDRLEGALASGYGPIHTLRMPAVRRVLGDDPRFISRLEEAGIPW